MRQAVIFKAFLNTKMPLAKMEICDISMSMRHKKIEHRFWAFAQLFAVGLILLLPWSQAFAMPVMTSFDAQMHLQHTDGSGHSVADCENLSATSDANNSVHCPKMCDGICASQSCEWLGRLSQIDNLTNEISTHGVYDIISSVVSVIEERPPRSI